MKVTGAAAVFVNVLITRALSLVGKVFAHLFFFNKLFKSAVYGGFAYLYIHILKLRQYFIGCHMLFAVLDKALQDL